MASKIFWIPLLISLTFVHFSKQNQVANNKDKQKDEKVDGPYLPSLVFRCEDQEGCKCSFDKQTVDSFCKFNRCPPNPKAIDTKCKHHEYCHLNLNNPCKAEQTGNLQIIHNIYGSVCTNDFEQYDYAFCPEGYMCQTAPPRSCKDQRIWKGSLCKSPECYCMGQPGKMNTNCMAGQICQEIEGNGWCEDSFAIPDTVCKNINGCTCGDINNLYYAKICAKDEVCILKDVSKDSMTKIMKGHCVKTTISNGEQCKDDDGCFCSTPPMIKKISNKNPLATAEEREVGLEDFPQNEKVYCKSLQMCLRSFVIGNCVDILLNKNVLTEEVNSVTGKAYCSIIQNRFEEKVPEEVPAQNEDIVFMDSKGKSVGVGEKYIKKLKIVRCFHRQVAKKEIGEDVFCENNSQSTVVIGGNDICYALKDDGCVCRVNYADANSKSTKCPTGDRCIVDGNSVSCRSDPIALQCPNKVKCYCGRFFG